MAADIRGCEQRSSRVGRPKHAAAPLPVVDVSRVLVVDDDPMLCRFLELSLGFHGHGVETARDYPAGLRAALRCAYDLLILDVFLPGGSGLDILRRLRAGPGREVPVIVLSGHHQEEIADRALDAGATAYVGKPFLLESLVGEIERLTREVPEPCGDDTATLPTASSS